MVYRSLAVKYSTKYPTTTANETPKDNWVLPTDNVFFPVNGNNTRTISDRTNIINVRIVRTLK